ncbi:MAG: hypothetical protein QXD60_01085 [Nanopusillaceae archaeon]
MAEKKTKKKTEATTEKKKAETQKLFHPNTLYVEIRDRKLPIKLITTDNEEKKGTILALGTYEITFLDNQTKDVEIIFKHSIKSIILMQK